MTERGGSAGARGIESTGRCVYIRMYSRAVNTMLRSNGCVQFSQKGSHVQFKHPQRPGRFTVPHLQKDIPTGTLRSIEKQDGLKLR